ncbi:MAG: SDR family NAD(P)-dependent oxidoreductase [Salibacteraceae bacterium]
MKIYYITGTSRGLGYAIANKLLKDENNIVIGIGRKCEIEHPNYKHKILDLSDSKETAKFRFAEHVKADESTLINNAGTLGDIKYLGDIDNKTLVEALNVNLIAPSILTNNFMASYKDQDIKQTVLNISSGAAVNSYDGWSTYCTSKAGVNMLSETLNLELQERGKENVRVLSIAPGIIKTSMQEEIRKADKADFSNVENFIELNDSNALQDADETAEKLIDLLNSNTSGPVFRDLRSE